jgi:transposase
MDRALLEVFLEQELSLEQIGALVDRHPSTVSYWLRKYGLEPVHKKKHAARGGIDRGNLESLVGTGASIREIAESLEVSIGTVRHWLRKYGVKTRRSAVREGREELAQARVRAIEMHCHRHGAAKFILEGRGYYRCTKCRQDRVARRRRQMKEELMAEFGGRCRICGYDKYAGALAFHHLDPSEKKFGLSSRGLTRAIDVLREEAQKCALLCHNCHAEVEAGLASL